MLNSMTCAKRSRLRALIITAILIVAMLSCSSEPDAFPVTGSERSIPAFTNVAREVMGGAYRVSNYRPGVAIFDYDRDGDQDIYLTQEAGHPNRLFRNDGDMSFVETAESAGVAVVEQGSSGIVACDVNNDGYQDLYVGGRGIQGDGLDFRSAHVAGENGRPITSAYADRLFTNNRDGSFTDVSDTAFGDSPNLRAASTIACADVDGDGWLDIFVANMIDEDYFFMGESNHPGHFNVMYRNNGDLTFSDVSGASGLLGEQVWMRDPNGVPLTFTDSEGVTYEGYDPSLVDKESNRVGDPTGPTHAATFFDYNDDLLPDLWVATDGDFLRLYRNDSTPGRVRFTSVEREMGFARVGNWMGFAIGDYDADSHLDVFATNAGYHLRLREPQPNPGPDCKYHERFRWGSCLNALLRNGAGRFEDVAPLTDVKPSALMPPASLDPDNINPAWPIPTGLAAYDFGYGATFFDMDNDGYQDLYWLGSEIASGDGPGGDIYQSAGRMLRNLEGNGFEDLTVETRLIDVQGIRYDQIPSLEPGQDPASIKLTPRYHENGKGLAHGDLNSDGYVDLIGTNSGGMLFTGEGYDADYAPGPTFMWLNELGSNNWITLRLEGRMAVDGTGSNADGIGARVYLKATLSDGSEPVIQAREVQAGSSYLSMDSVELEFGLGSASKVEEVNIAWPSGRVQTLTGLDVNQVMKITEPPG